MPSGVLEVPLQALQPALQVLCFLQELLHHPLEEPLGLQQALQQQPHSKATSKGTLLHSASTNCTLLEQFAQLLHKGCKGCNFLAHRPATAPMAVKSCTSCMTHAGTISKAPGGGCFKAAKV